MFLSKGSKLGIGRPFIKFDSAEEMQQFFKDFKSRIPSLLIPAHVVTPDGILGGKNPVDSVSEIWGECENLIDALESGLSADPDMLSSVSGALGIPVISSSDAHSAAFNRLGREFTEINADEVSTEGVFSSIKNSSIIKTAEFPPFEGRYYLTGHRGDRDGHNGEDVFSLIILLKSVLSAASLSFTGLRKEHHIFTKAKRNQVRILCIRFLLSR